MAELVHRDAQPQVLPHLCCMPIHLPGLRAGPNHRLFRHLQPVNRQPGLLRRQWVAAQHVP